jgi:nitrite reductase (NADH) small subunit
MQEVFLSDTEYEKVAAQTQELIGILEETPYPKVKEDVQLLLQSFDLLHREALTRLFREIIINHPDLRSKMESDKAINLLFSLYDLFQTGIHHTSLTHEDGLHSNGNNKYPLWIPIGNEKELKEDTAYKYAEEGENILLCKSGGSLYAIKNCCGNTALPLDGAAIEKGYLICPWHGCVYSLSDGVMETNPMYKLKKYPLEISADGEIRIGLNM